MEYQVPLEPPFNIMIAAGNDLVILVFREGNKVLAKCMCYTCLNK